MGGRRGGRRIAQRSGAQPSRQAANVILKITSSQNYNHAGTGANEEQRGGAGIAEGDERGFSVKKRQDGMLLPPVSALSASPRPRDCNLEDRFKIT